MGEIDNLADQNLQEEERIEEDTEKKNQSHVQ